jgi:hypothetical protein
VTRSLEKKGCDLPVELIMHFQPTGKMYRRVSAHSQSTPGTAPEGVGGSGHLAVNALLP